MTLLGNVLVVIGLCFMSIGLYGTFRFNNFYTRVLVASKVDIIGDITILLGFICKHGLSFFSAKLLLLIIILMVINPLSSHIIVRSAYHSGYKMKKG